MILYIVFLIIPNTNAYNSSDAITLFADSPDVWTSLFLVPEGKDLILNRVYSNDVNEILSIRDNGGDILYSRSGKEEYFGGFIVIKDNLELITEPGLNAKITLFGYLVSEDEEVQYYIEGNSSAWTQHIFNKKDIDFIYFREFIIMFFLSIIKFFSIIIGGRKIGIF